MWWGGMEVGGGMDCEPGDQGGGMLGEGHTVLDHQYC